MNYLDAFMEASVDKESTAAHEAAHFIAASHFGFPVGDKGVSIKWDGTEYSGFLDIDFKEVLRQDDPDCLSLDQYVAIRIIGPLYELMRYRSLNEAELVKKDAAIKQIILRGRDDFGRVAQDYELGAPDDLPTSLKLGRFFAGLYLGREIDAPNSEVRERATASVALVRQLIQNYADDIDRFARVLCQKMNLSQDEVTAWLRDNFVRRNLS
jgi:hypothetical protein